MTITIEQLERETGSPAARWAGKCYGVACAAARLIDGAAAVYGHWLGDVAAGTLFAPKHIGFVQHGWVQLPDGAILDPTRWVFEGVEPYIYCGPNDYYDEGGNKLRTALQGAPPAFDTGGKRVAVSASVLAPDAWTVVERMLHLDRAYAEGLCEPGQLTMKQLLWLANADPRSMYGHAEAIYTMLARLGLQAFIPIDNLRMVENGRL